MRWLTLLTLVLLAGCVKDPGYAPQSTPEKPVAPVASNEQLACYYEALADGVEKGWFASPNEFLARAKATREKLGLPASGDAANGLLPNGASTEPFTADGKKTLIDGLKGLAKKARG
jgi:hypothetical protein